MDELKQRESMVLYLSAYKAIQKLPDVKMKWAAADMLMRYGFYGEEPDTEDYILQMFFIQAKPGMMKAKERYEAAVENGKTGGRPTEIKDEDVERLKHDGLSNKAIAEKFGCSEKNIEARITKINKQAAKNPKNPNNLTDNETVNDNVTDYSVMENREKESEERRIADLKHWEAAEIVEKLRKKVPYNEIQREYNLKKGTVTKGFESQWLDACPRRICEDEELPERFSEADRYRIDRMWVGQKLYEHEKKEFEKDFYLFEDGRPMEWTEYVSLMKNDGYAVNDYGEYCVISWPGKSEVLS